MSVRTGSRPAAGFWHYAAVSTLPAQREAERPSELLVVRLGAIGDVVNALVFASAVKAELPAARIGWVVHPLAAPLVEGHPDVDRVHVWRKGGGPSEFRRVLREVRSERYPLAIDLQRIQKSALLARLSGAKRIVGFDRGHAKEGSWLWTTERLSSDPTRVHMVDHYLGFARHLGLRAEHPVRRLPEEPGSERWAEGLVDELGGAPVLVNLGATKPANRWPAERFGELAAKLERTMQAPICLTGSEADREAEARALSAAGSLPGVRSLVGRTSLPQLVALCRRARLFIGCDTGPMHIAAALGTPVLALFGPADPRRTGPFGDAHQVLRVPPACAPCNRRTCNQSRHACMEDITVELVATAAQELAATERRMPAQ